MAQAPDKATIGQRIAPPRFLMFLLLYIAGFVGWHFAGGESLADALTLAFDGAALVFLVSLWPLTRDVEPEDLRRHARENDANRIGVLLITSAVGLVVLASIAGELPEASHGGALAMGKLLGTLALTWLFANVIYALHYAHCFYTADDGTGKDTRGLDFSGTECPDYWDFIYFAFTLGMTFQTSDTGVSSGHMRRVVTLHSMAAFVFNIGIIAFTINSLGGGK